MHKRLIFIACLVSCLFCFGCKKPKSLAEKGEEKSNTGIIGKKTDEVGEFDPAAGRKVKDPKVKNYNPLNPASSMRVLDSTNQRLAQMGITRAVELFHAAQGRYPKDHDEFMEKIIRENGIKLPVLSGKKEYQYDVQNHKLIVVEPID